MTSLLPLRKDVSMSDPWPEIWPLLPGRLGQAIKLLPVRFLDGVEEIRLRTGRPLVLTAGGRSQMVGREGSLAACPGQAIHVGDEDMKKTVELFSASSLYALEEELRRGFITLPGGHRVGLCGQAVLKGGWVRTLKHLSGLNIRLCREVKGTGLKILPHIYDQRAGRFYHTMLVSAPGCGKTTVLRDLIRLISSGVSSEGIPEKTVGLVDERSEVAGCYQGVPSRDVGINTDVLDACPKAEGMIMLLRSMGPQVIACDEVGTPDDVAALLEAQHAGVSILATAHARSVDEARARPFISRLFQTGGVERVVLLNRSTGPGTVQEIKVLA